MYVSQSTETCLHNVSRDMTGTGNREIKDATEIIQQLPAARNESTRPPVKKARSASWPRIPSLEEFAIRVEPNGQSTLACIILLRPYTAPRIVNMTCSPRIGVATSCPQPPTGPPFHRPPHPTSTSWYIHMCINCAKTCCCIKHTQYKSLPKPLCKYITILE